MNDLANFIYEGREVRTLERDGDPWFVAKDVCDVLGIENSRDTLAKTLDDDEKGVDTIYTRSENGVMQNREMNIINESGLYNLIFQSRKPEARAFRKWVTSEVLPSIRKKGFYALPALMERLEKALEDPQKAVYEELEAFVKRTLTPEETPVHKTYLFVLWHAYEKEVKNLLDKHVFMYKIAMDHPEFKLKHDKYGWYFAYCDVIRLI
jgi:prophage antirepressor-like protein